MSSEWLKLNLGELCAQQGGAIMTGPFGSQLHTADYRVEGIPVVMPTNIVGSRVAEAGIARIDKVDVERLSQHKLRIGDLVFSRRGDVTKNALVRAREVGWLCGTGCLKVRLGDESMASAEFVSYYLQLPEIKEWLTRHAVGATMPNLNTGILSAVPLVLAPLQMQLKIVRLLASLDSSILAFQQQNTSLESLAQTLFRSWFVDFDPVHVKLAGSEPEAMSSELALLFPTEFENSELGLIPKGWNASTVGDAFEVNPRRSLSKGCMAPFLDMANVNTSGHRPTQRLELREFGSGTKFTNGDTLLARITPCLENGKTAYVDFLNPGEVAGGSTEFIVLRTSGAMPQYWSYLLARNDSFRNFAINAMTGTSGRQRVDVSTLKRYPFVVPTTKLLKAVSPIFEAIQKQMACNSDTVLSLSSLRDHLLPRLISGKLRIEDAEASVAAITSGLETEPA